MLFNFSSNAVEFSSVFSLSLSLPHSFHVSIIKTAPTESPSVAPTTPPSSQRIAPSISPTTVGDTLCTTDNFGGIGGSPRSDLSLGRIDRVEWDYNSALPGISIHVISSSSSGNAISASYGLGGDIPCESIDVSGDNGYFSKAIIYYGTVQCSVPGSSYCGNYVR